MEHNTPVIDAAWAEAKWQLLRWADTILVIELLDTEKKIICVLHTPDVVTEEAVYFTIVGTALHSGEIAFYRMRTAYGRPLSPDTRIENGTIKFTQTHLEKGCTVSVGICRQAS